MGAVPWFHFVTVQIEDRGIFDVPLWELPWLAAHGPLACSRKRLERAGCLRRRQDPNDGRQQILSPGWKGAQIQDVVNPLREDVVASLQNRDPHQLTAIAEFLARITDLVYRHAALVHAHKLSVAIGGTEERPHQQ
jgi:hypothetical protein